jgi:hypothetical protein
MEPFVGLMRRYVFDYSCSHDIKMVREVMMPEFICEISGMQLHRDADYAPRVSEVYERFPGLALAVHDIITNGDRLAMRFSEHGAGADRQLASWQVVALYSWNGQKLTYCRCEQDFYGRLQQLKSGEPQPLEPAHIDPWTTTVTAPADPDVEGVARRWLECGALGAVASGRIDDCDVREFEPVLDVVDVDVLDLFSAGSRAAFHVALNGEYRGGLHGLTDKVGASGRLTAAGILDIADGTVTKANVVTDRYSLRQALRT